MFFNSENKAPVSIQSASALGVKWKCNWVNLKLHQGSIDAGDTQDLIWTYVSCDNNTFGKPESGPGIWHVESHKPGWVRRVAWAPVYLFVGSVGLCTVLRCWEIYLCPVNVPDCCPQPVPSTRHIMCPVQTTEYYTADYSPS